MKDHLIKFFIKIVTLSKSLQKLNSVISFRLEFCVSGIMVGDEFKGGILREKIFVLFSTLVSFMSVWEII